ncbi:MAG: hypothetical protein ACJAS9_001188 [Polaribacter sp.]
MESFVNMVNGKKIDRYDNDAISESEAGSQPKVKDEVTESKAKLNTKLSVSNDKIARL